MVTPLQRSTVGICVIAPFSTQDGADRGGELTGDVGDEQVDAVADDVAAADHHVGDVGGGGGEYGRVKGHAVGGARGPHAVQGNRDQVGTGAGGDLPRVGPAQAGVPGRARGAQQGLGGEVAAGLAGQAFGVLDAAGFFEEVHHRVAVAAQGE